MTGRAPTTWEQVNEQAKFLAGKKDPLTGLDAYGVLDPLKYSWGGFGFYFLADRAVAYAKHPSSPAWLFDPDTMKPLVNNPGWVQAIQDVIDLKDAAGAYPPDQINADPNATAFQQFLAGTGSQVLWWGDVGSNARTSDTSVVGDVVGFDINPGANKVYNWQHGRLGGDREPVSQRTRTSAGASMSPTVCRRTSSSASARGRPRPTWVARTSRCGWLPIRPASSPTATRTSTSTNGWPRATTRRSSRTTCPRTPTATTIRTRRTSRASRASSSTTPAPRTNS